MWTMSDELSASPVYTRQLAGISNLVRAELDHPRIVAVRAELAALGARRRADGAHFDDEEGSALAAAIDAAMAVGYAAIEEEAPSFQRLFGRGGVTTLLITAFDEELGSLLPLRLLNIPEYPPRPFRLLLHDADVQEMAGQLAVGQVWVNATELDETQYRELWSAISFQRHAALGVQDKPRGRHRGFVTEQRAAVVADIQAHPTWTDVEVYDCGRDAGLWDGYYYDAPEQNRKRVQRLRRTAGVRRAKSPAKKSDGK